jgi:hypothetical protein
MEQHVIVNKHPTTNKQKKKKKNCSPRRAEARSECRAARTALAQTVRAPELLPINADQKQTSRENEQKQNKKGEKKNEKKKKGFARTDKGREHEQAEKR